MKILVLDNYDSFTYNLVHIIRELGYKEQMEIHRNDKIDMKSVQTYDKILLSPGPGIPAQAGIMPQLIQEYAATKSILGVCLGHQSIAEAFGAKIYNLPEVYHGVTHSMSVTQTDEPLFKEIPAQFKACRYHSWTVEKENLPDCLKITAVDADGGIMALSHSTYDVKGVQFHPESIMTEHGSTMIKNWIEL